MERCHTLAGWAVSLARGEAWRACAMATYERLGATPIDVSFRFPTAGTITLRIPVLPLSRGAGSPTPARS
ncbi:hypothetical protein [Microbispora rosea]|uniref:hypothetical protein n=1 Tax=Microbispora rosea TaxID=58117 RepID=UPI003D9257CE